MEPHSLCFKFCPTDFCPFMNYHRLAAPFLTESALQYPPNTHTHTHTRTPWSTTGGVVYTRWGRTTCPNTTGTQLLYAGKAAGSSHSEKGGGANHICLPEQPQYSTFTTGVQTGRAYLHGALYVTGGNQADSGPLNSVSGNVVQCATLQHEELL